MRRTLKACKALFIIKVAAELQYRAAAWAHSSVGIFWAALHIVMFTVFYTYGNEENAAITLSQAISYAWLAQILYSLTALSYLGIDDELREKIVDGNVSLELCRPLDLYAHWFTKSAANRLGGSFWRIVITILVALLAPAAFRLSPPASAFGFIFFLLSAASAFLFTAAYVMLLTAIRVRLTWGDGPTTSLAFLGMLLGGSYLPLQLWPDFLQRILLFQPFAGRLDIPIRLFIGSMPPEDALWAIGIQLTWTIIFIAVGKLLMKRNISQLIVQGG